MNSASNANADFVALLSHALALEQEAVERYADLADLMSAHNNTEIAAVFKKFSEIESLHVTHIRELAARNGLSEIPVVDYRWRSPEGPETIDPADLHYLMTPHQALSLALINEQRACDYYRNVASNTDDRAVQSLAGELAQEENEHVGMVKVWLDRYPAPQLGWDEDDDAPIVQD